ncbi:hypothetical protein [Massilia sp. erpn]|uniref:hypothetical protein n=1 Tax=Massilia sp. erpn TaxID=2738142 RepID=UPI002105D2D7|nr:hypothetical protein [Massilia sp. erpn]UTY56250.1 hypothetical protein HPQ68_03020 [Massilia sp. erpn]
MKHTLTITIDATSVALIQAAGQYVTLSRGVSQLVDSVAGQSLAWQVIPAAQTIVFAWDDDCYLYQSSGTLAFDQPVYVGNQSQEPAVPGYDYVFDGAQFAATPGQGSAYAVRNGDSRTRSALFGLLQAASVNAAPVTATPVSCQPVLYGQRDQLLLAAGVQIYLSSAPLGGWVIGDLPGSALTVAEDGAQVGFDRTTNAFFLLA